MPFGPSILYKNRDLGGRARGIGPRTLFKIKNCRSDTTNCNFRSGLEFSNPNMPDDIPTNKLQKCTVLPLLFRSTSGMYPIPLGCRVYPIRGGLDFYAPQPRATPIRVVADVWENDIWEFQAKSGSSGSCCLFLHSLGKITVQEMSGKTPGSPRHPSSRLPRPSDP